MSAIKKIGLALGGGGAKGLAHIGIIKEIVNRKDGALFKGESIADKLREELKNIKIEDLQIPFAALATNTKNGDEVRLQNGDWVDAIRASTALPIVFAPVAINGHLLIDGGLANPVPADVVKDMGAEYIIAVDVSSRWFV